MSAIRVFSPVPDERYANRQLAPRPKSVAGLRVGLLGNLKPNCDVLLHTSGEQLLQAGALETMFREKTSCSLGATESMLDEIASQCRVAVVALGD
jgi:hypothetical protein